MVERHEYFAEAFEGLISGESAAAAEEAVVAVVAVILDVDGWKIVALEGFEIAAVISLD